MLEVSTAIGREKVLMRNKNNQEYAKVIQSTHCNEPIYNTPILQIIASEELPLLYPVRADHIYIVAAQRRTINKPSPLIMRILAHAHTGHNPWLMRERQRW
jgi:hypothetical protein